MTEDLVHEAMASGVSCETEASEIASDGSSHTCVVGGAGHESMYMGLQAGNLQMVDPALANPGSLVASIR